jgi:hypothetical protein
MAFAYLATVAAAEAATAITAEATTTLAATTAAAAEAATGTTEATTTSGAVFLRTGFIDGQGTAAEIDAIGLFSGQLGLITGTHGDEGEATGAARVTVEGDVNVGDGTVLLEMSAEFVFGSLEGQIADVEFGTMHVDES